MLQPPEGFESSLKNYDPALSLRWGSAVKMWVIERRAHISAGKTLFLRNASRRPGVDPKAVEEYRSAQSGCHVIHYVATLDRRVHDYLWDWDLQRKGNGPNSQIAAELRSFDRATEARKAESHDIAVQTSDIIHHALTKQSSKIHAGRMDDVLLDALGRRPQGQKFYPARALYDAYSRPLAPKTPKKLLLASS